MPKYNPNPLFPNEPLFEIHDFSELPKSPRYTLYCNGQEQTVYHTDSFDYAIVVRRDDAPVSVEVCVSDSFKKAVLRPQSLEIPFDREENHIRFSLPYKAKVSLELDNDLKRPLLILSSCYVAPRSKGETYYFRKGQIYNVGNLELKSGESAYLEEGCVVCGRIYSNMADNVRVSGNGILYGGVWHKPDENGGRLMASFYLGKHILVEGISVVDNGVWNVVPGACRDVIIRDVNIMSRLVTGDGIDIVGCEEVLVEDCFIRACDDCVCIKACALPGPAACCNVRDIKVRRCVLWNAEPGNALEIGYELRCNEVSDVVFEDCDIIHCEYEGNQSGGVLTIHNADRAKVHNVRYENIRIEDAQEKLVDIKILDCKYSLDRVRGDVENIVFRNIDVTGPLFPVSIIRGFEMTNEMHRPRYRANPQSTTSTIKNRKLEMWQLPFGELRDAIAFCTDKEHPMDPLKLEFFISRIMTSLLFDTGRGCRKEVKDGMCREVQEIMETCFPRCYKNPYIKVGYFHQLPAVQKIGPWIFVCALRVHGLKLLTKLVG